MKYSLPILSLLAVLFLSGCSTKKTTEGQDFSQLPVYELKGKEVPTDSAYLRYAYRIRVEGDVAVVFDLHGSDYFVMPLLILSSITCLLSGRWAKDLKKLFRAATCAF